MESEVECAKLKFFWSPMAVGRKHERRDSGDLPPMERSLHESHVGWSTHFFLKWPTYLIIAVFTLLLLVGYGIVRGIIKLFEGFMEDRITKKLRKRMIHAKTYKEWQAVARKLDKYLGLDDWKGRRSRYINAATIDKYMQDIKAARDSNDALHLSTGLSTCLNDPLTSGVLKEELYSQCWDGTKTIVEEYIQSIMSGLTHLNGLLQPSETNSYIREHLLQSVNHLIRTCSYGKTGLCLSGGGSLGQQHFGVVKALREENMLPNIISGTSAGAVVGAFVCTRTEEELDRDFTPEFIKSISTALDSSWLQRFWRFIRYGELFDFNDWVSKIPPWTCGDLTFLEAYKKTGKVLNVSTTTFNNFSVNLNYITSPNVLIRSAVLCSSAMPFFVKSPQLLEKCGTTDNPKIVTRDAVNFSDGSLAGDVPRGELASLFGVRFALTSQVNPHITPFFFNRKGEAGNPLMWRWGKQGSFRGGFILSTLESFFKEQMKTLLKVMRDVEIDPAFHGVALPQAFLQNFMGDITVTSHRHFWWKVFHCLDGPKDAAEIDWWIKEGELMMWPKMSVIISRMKIEKCIDELSKTVALNFLSIKTT